MQKLRTPHFWQAIYLATLALFLVCLFGGVLGVATISCRLSFDARCDEFLARQRAFVQRLSQDVPAVAENRPAALDSLYVYHAMQANSDGMRVSIRLNGQTCYSDLPVDDDLLPELTLLEPGQRSWQVREVMGRHLIFATTSMSGSMEGYVITACADMEEFFRDWQRTALLFTLLCAAVSVLFAAGLYAVLRRMNRPLQSLTETARQVAAGDYTARTPVADTRRDELGELGRTLNDMTARVQDQLAQLAAEADGKQALVDDLSHEMRTPLTAIGGYAQTIRLADLRGEELMQAAESIEFESRRLLNLSEQLLRLSVLNHEAPEFHDIPAGTLMGRVLNAVGPKAAARGVRLEAVPDPDTVDTPVSCQPDLMESLLVNLCDNGVKACAAGGRVVLAFAVTGKQSAFVVKDNGRGMDAETLARIGRPFYRADKARSRAEGGAGLGVSICYAIAKAHGAELTYTSQPGQGTTATLRLAPRTANPAVPTAGPGHSGFGAGEDPAFLQPRNTSETAR